MTKALITVVGSLLIIVFVTIPLIRSWVAVRASRRNQPPEGLGYVLLLRFPFAVPETGIRSRLSGYFGDKFDATTFRQVNQGTYTFKLGEDLFELASLFDVYRAVPRKENLIQSEALAGNWMDHHAHLRITCWGKPAPELQEQRLEQMRSLVAVLWPAEGLALIEMHSGRQVTSSNDLRRTMLDGEKPAWDSELVWFLNPARTS